MAPEQARGETKAVAPACDIYALGAILYELLTGRPPFQADTPLDTLLQVIQDDPVPPGQRQAGIPRDLETVCLKCLRKQPSHRYESARALAADLGQVAAGEPVQARSVTRREKVWRWCQRNALVGGLAAATGLLLVGLLGAGAAAWRMRDVARREAAAARIEAEAREEAEANRRAAEAARDAEVRRAAEPRPEPAAKQEPPALAGTPRLEADARVTVYPGKAARLGVKLDRDGCAGPVVVSLEGLPAGVTAPAVVIAPGQTRADLLLAATAEAQVSTAAGTVIADHGDRRVSRAVAVAVTRPAGEVYFVKEPSKAPEVRWNNGSHVVDSTCVIDAVALSPDGKAVLTYAHQQHLRLWDLTTGKEIRRFYAKRELPEALGGPSAKAVTQQKREAWLRDNQRGPERVRALTFSPDGRHAVAVGYAVWHGISVWDVATGSELFRLKGRSEALGQQSRRVLGKRGIAYSPDGATILTHNTGAVAFLTSATAGQRSVTFQADPQGVFPPRDAEGGQPTSSFDCRDVGFADGGKQIVGATGSALFAADLTGRVLRQFELRAKPSPGSDLVAFSADGRRALTLDQGEPLRVIDLEAMKELRTLDAGQVVTCVALSSTGKLALTGDWQGTLLLWDLETGRVRRRFEGHSSLIGQVVDLLHDRGWRPYDNLALARCVSPRWS